MTHLIKRFIDNNSGATAIEYGLIAGVVGVGIIAALTGVKNSLNTKFDAIATNLNSAK